MVPTVYRVVRQKGHGFGVDLTMPDRSHRLVSGFESEHEADAWIVQTKRFVQMTWPREALPIRETERSRHNASHKAAST